jgi:hypothetical protein
MVGLSKVGFVGLASLLGAVLVGGDGIGSGVASVGDGADASGERVVVALLGVGTTSIIVGDTVGTSTTGGLKMGPKLGDGALGVGVGVIVLFVGLATGRNDGRFVGALLSPPSQNDVKSA